MCAMSLSALIYSKIRRITLVDNMILIVIVGNQLYSSLSLLKRQSLLMLTELPGMLTVFERFFQLEYGECYTCVGIYSIEGGRYIKYLVLVLELCMVTAIIVKGHVYYWKYHPYICLDLLKRG